jgi:hypothetical protein
MYTTRIWLYTTVKTPYLRHIQAYTARMRWPYSTTRLIHFKKGFNMSSKYVDRKMEIESNVRFPQIYNQFITFFLDGLFYMGCYCFYVHYMVTRTLLELGESWAYFFSSTKSWYTWSTSKSRPTTVSVYRWHYVDANLVTTEQDIVRVCCSLPPPSVFVIFWISPLFCVLRFLSLYFNFPHFWTTIPSILSLPTSPSIFPYRSVRSSYLPFSLYLYIFFLIIISVFC